MLVLCFLFLFLLPQVLRQRVKCIFNIQAKHIQHEFCYLLRWKYDKALVRAFKEPLSSVILKYRVDYFVGAGQACCHVVCSIQMLLCNCCNDAVTQLPVQCKELKTAVSDTFLLITSYIVIDSYLFNHWTYCGSNKCQCK